MIVVFLVVVQSDHGKRIGLDEEECGQVLGQGDENGVHAACAEHGIPAFDNEVDWYTGPAEI